MKWRYREIPREGEEAFNIVDKFWIYGAGSVALVLEEGFDHWHAKLIVGPMYVYCVEIKGSTDEERQEKALKWAKKEWERLAKRGQRTFG